MEQGQIRVSHLSKSYGDHTVFEDFSAVFQKGQTTCMMAPPGAGKDDSATHPGRAGEGGLRTD